MASRHRKNAPGTFSRQYAPGEVPRAKNESSEFQLTAASEIERNLICNLQAKIRTFFYFHALRRFIKKKKLRA